MTDNSDINHGDFERIACLVFCGVTPLFLSARFWSRILSKQLGVDDWAAVAACVGFTSFYNSYNGYESEKIESKSH